MEQELSAVLYTDGGAWPNPGWAGSGVHGYLYTKEVPKRGLGLGSIVATDQGYFNTEKVGNTGGAVTVTQYVDIYATVEGEYRTNNMGELVGAILALRYIAKHDVKSVLVYLDSDYVTKGINQRIAQWVRYNWIKPDGQPVKNKEYWLQLIEALNVLKQKGVKLTFQWTKGHVDTPESIGNNKADKLATAGRIRSAMTHGAAFEAITESDPSGYWKAIGKRDPLFYPRWVYFMSHVDRQEKGIYYVGNQGPKDDSMMGVRSGDGAFGVVSLKEPDFGIEDLRIHLCIDGDGEEFPAAINADVFYSNSFQADWTQYGEVAYERQNLSLPNAKTLTGVALASQFTPPAHAVRAINTVSTLYTILAGLEASDFASVPTCQVTNITDVFYQKTTVDVKIPGSKEKTKKEVSVLKPEYISGFSTLKIDAPYDKTTCTQGPGTASISLTLGVDMPDRNSLKRLEEDQIDVYLVCITESDDCFRYYVAIRSGRATALYCAIYSNFRFII